MVKHKTSCEECLNYDCLIKRSCSTEEIEAVEAEKVSLKIRKKQSIIQEGSIILQATRTIPSPVIVQVGCGLVQMSLLYSIWSL
jgi:hypothetical protein